MSRKLAYIVSRFPKISETFILYEIVELRNLGFEVDIFPLIREKEAVQHPEVEALAGRTHYQAILSVQVILSQFYWMVKRPGTYFSTFWNVIKGNSRSLKFLIRGIAAFLLAGVFSRHIQRARIGHVHAHWATHPALAAYVIHRLTGLPYSFTAHAHDIYVDQSMLSEKIAASEFVVTISEFNRRFLTGLYGEQLGRKIDVIHCGIDLDVFHARQANSTSDVFTLICVASLEEKKGHRYLIEACGQLLKNGLEFRCLLVGDGELRATLEASVEQQGLSKQITFLGRQPRQRVGELLAQSQVLILPSIITSRGKMEGIPVALMEGMAMEMPVIATDISGVSELVENGVTGLLVPEKDATALAGAIQRLRDAPEVAIVLGQNGRRKVVQEFDLHRNTEDLSRRFLEIA
jgi:glycosyltransferase involved in cell wall biosynthesis